MMLPCRRCRGFGTDFNRDYHGGLYEGDCTACGGSGRRPVNWRGVLGAVAYAASAVGVVWGVWLGIAWVVG